MTRPLALIALIGFLLSPFSPPAGATTTHQLSLGLVSITPIASDLEEAWAVAFLPEGEFLVTLRGGTMLRFDSQANPSPISGVPEVYARGQGGLLDVLVPADFADTQEIFFTFAKPQANNQAGTALARARLINNRLENLTIIWEMDRGSRGGRHFGSRIVEGADGYLYITIGDRADRPSAQNLNTSQGSVLRLSRDGLPPPDNPFHNTANAKPEIWSYGHRNAQGAALDANQQLWVIEHGAQGGDEVNRVIKGANYGWPVIAYGRHYSGAKIGSGTHAPGMQQPAFYWDPSIAPSGAAFYTGAMFPEWHGDLLVGALKYDLISRLEVAPDGSMQEAERIANDQTWRVRDVRVAPDGSIWFISVAHKTLYSLAR